MRLDEASGPEMTDTTPIRAGERHVFPRRAVRILGWETTVLVGGRESGGRLAVIEVEGKRGDAVPLHAHQHEDDVLYVIEGELTVRVDDEVLFAPGGSAITLPRGVEHSFVVESEGARMLLVASPAGLESFLYEMGETKGADGHTLERLVGVAARYGVDFTGPPPERQRTDE